MHYLIESEPLFPVHLLGLSLTSRRCKQIVINTKTRAVSLQVIIGNSVAFVINNSIMEMWLAFSITYDVPSSPKSLRAPSSFRISTYDHEDPVEELMDPWRLSADIDFKNWLDHIISVFHRPDTIDYVKFEQFLTPFDLKDIKEVFGNTNGLDVQHTGCYEYNQLILKEFLPVKHFSVDTVVFQDSSVPKNLLIQNFDTFVIGFHNVVLKTMDLDDLLLMNSKDIDVEGLEMSPKEFNRFLKLWIQGAMPQLEYLSILFLNRVEEDKVMNGINYQKRPSARTFKRHGDKEEYIISDGMDFYGKDGLKATVQINHGNLENYFELFVFHDHYIVTVGGSIGAGENDSGTLVSFSGVAAVASDNFEDFGVFVDAGVAKIVYAKIAIALVSWFWHLGSFRCDFSLFFYIGCFSKSFWSRDFWEGSFR
ncbi:unnamed protein product [Caenorhabditis brenneri]